MEKDIYKKNQIRYYLTTTRRFYSLCRKVNGSNLNNQDYLNIFIEKFKKLYEAKSAQNYFDLLDNLNKLILKNKLCPNEAVYVLINTIDPNLEMYKLDSINEEKEKTKKEIMKKYHFYDPFFVSKEKEFVNNIDSNKKLLHTKEALN